MIGSFSGLPNTLTRASKVVGCKRPLPSVNSIDFTKATGKFSHFAAIVNGSVKLPLLPVAGSFAVTVAE